MVDVYSGSLHDAPEFAGEHHAFEHLPFRGTKNFPSKRELAYPLERYDAELRANTSFRRTRYFVTLPTAHLDAAAQHLADMVFSPVLREEDWESEREIILQEWEMGQKNSQRVISQEIYRHVFEGTSLAFLPIGEPETIQRLTIDRLRYLHLRDYTVNNCSLIVAGNLPKDLPKTLERWFGRLRLEEGVDNRDGKIPTPRNLNSWSVHHLLFKQPTMALLAWYPRLIDQRLDYAGEIANRALGNGLSSALFYELRERRNWVYSFGLDWNTFAASLHAVQFLTSTERASVEQVAEVLHECVCNLKSDTERFEFSRTGKLSRIAMRRFDPTSICNRVADHLMDYEPILSDEEQAQVYESISFEEFVDALDQLYNLDNFSSLVVSG